MSGPPIKRKRLESGCTFDALLVPGLRDSNIQRLVTDELPFLDLVRFAAVSKQARLFAQHRQILRRRTLAAKFGIRAGDIHHIRFSDLSNRLIGLRTGKRPLSLVPVPEDQEPFDYCKAAVEALGYPESDLDVYQFPDTTHVLVFNLDHRIIWVHLQGPERLIKIWSLGEEVGGQQSIDDICKAAISCGDDHWLALLQDDPPGAGILQDNSPEANATTTTLHIFLNGSPSHQLKLPELKGFGSPFCKLQFTVFKTNELVLILVSSNPSCLFFYSLSIHGLKELGTNKTSEHLMFPVSSYNYNDPLCISSTPEGLTIRLLLTTRTRREELCFVRTIRLNPRGDIKHSDESAKIPASLCAGHDYPHLVAAGSKFLILVYQEEGAGSSPEFDEEEEGYVVPWGLAFLQREKEYGRKIWKTFYQIQLPQSSDLLDNPTWWHLPRIAEEGIGVADFLSGAPWLSHNDETYTAPLLD